MLLAAFGEKISYNLPKKQILAKQKIEPAWAEGVFLGFACDSNEYIVGINRGVIRAHTTKRRPEQEGWSVEALNDIQGAPWKPVPSRSGPKTPTHVCEGWDVEDEEG